MSKVTSADGTSIAYERSGEGPAVIVVGGAFNDKATAAPLAEQLAPRFTVVRYDRRGRGDSGDTLPYDVAREVEDLGSLVREIGGKPALFGMSSGAALAVRAVAAGVPVSRLALYEVPFAPDDDAAREHVQQKAEALRALLREGRNGDAVIQFMRGMGMPPEMADGMRHAPAFPALEAMAPTLAYDSEVMGDSTGGAIPAGLVASVKIPTLVAHGGAGSEQIADISRQLSALLPDGSLVTLPGQTHDVAADAIAPVLAEFFNADT
jgi:pimeloyl-ACP methyl ester carboxylesterase